MSKHRPFEFQGTNPGKFFIAGTNYISKVVNFKRDKATLLMYLFNNKEEVCNDGCSKGFCTHSCTTCRIQGCYERAMLIIALMPEYKKEKELPACKRFNMSWEEYKKEI